ncbi:hypothetical protein QAD02_005674 [Eretmocerus hayati]|uniref:Uncharacterized protein n=1 Tax=Eretmocerus hayati TaxID=131215 RepID=A0ACC2NW19_9HYME|nr:hypothetical protein QAD02_005674 [Eretmocerus hayati]
MTYFCLVLLVSFTLTIVHRVDGTDADIAHLNRATPSTGHGSGVSDSELADLTESLFKHDDNNANKYLTINLQQRTNGNNPDDMAPQPLIVAKQEALKIPTIEKLIALHDNYKLNTAESEIMTKTNVLEEETLIRTFLDTKVMSQAMNFLASKGLVKRNPNDYKQLLREIWFTTYPRGGHKASSSGFEHVFLAELKLGKELIGLHNWVYFLIQEFKQNLNYLGYMKSLNFGNRGALVKAHIRFQRIDKPSTGVLIGTSPELEMALYTVCFLTRQNQRCPISLGGSRFNIVTYTFKFQGKNLIGSAYPEL